MKQLGSTLFNIPIEPLMHRYSSTWYNRIPMDLARLDVKTVEVSGHTESWSFQKDGLIENGGEFLDPEKTLVWKTRQIQTLLRHLDPHDDLQPKIGDGDVLFFHDLWFPGIEALFYRRNALGPKFKIAGFLHAGVYDPADWLNAKRMGSWGLHFEKMLLDQVDALFLATDFHKRLIGSVHKLPDNTMVSGLPTAWNTDLCSSSRVGTVKKKAVVFPHRLAPEKNPNYFDKVANSLRSQFPEWQFVRTKDLDLSREEYYKVLEESAISVSTASQETWGIAMQESTILHCLPLVPDRLSYREMFPYPENRYYPMGHPDEFLCLAKPLARLMEAFDANGKDLHRLTQMSYELALDFELKAASAMTKVISNLNSLDGVSL